MHAVRGTIGYDPIQPSPAAKRASRDRHFAGLSGAEVEQATRRDRADEAVTANANIDEAAGFLVEWVNPQGQERFCGKASGGISAESVVRLIGTLTRNGVATVFTVTRTR